MTTLLIWAAAGGILNRFSGWADYLPGRNIYWASIAAFLLVWAFYGAIWGALVMLSCLTYRIPGWHKSLDIGTAPGRDALADAAVMYLRGLYFAPVFLFAAYWQGSFYPIVYLMLASAGAVMAYIVGNHLLAKHVKDPFWFIEFAAGCSFGAAVGLVVV